MSIIKDLIDQVVSFAFSEYAGKFLDARDQRRRKKQLTDGILCILDSEQPNWYYNDLTKVLSQSPLLKDLIVDFFNGKTLPCFEERLNDAILWSADH